MVVSKLHTIMSELSKVGKDMLMQVRGGEYKVISEAAVLKEIRPKFIEHKLVMWPETVQHVERVNNVTTVSVTFRLQDVEEGDHIHISVVGQGSDTQDKGAGMAMTYANKYALLKSLLLVASEDPDAQTSEALDEEAKERKRRYDTIIRWCDKLVELGVFSAADVRGVKASAKEAFDSHDAGRLERGMNVVRKFFTDNNQEVPPEATAI